MSICLWIAPDVVNESVGTESVDARVNSATVVVITLIMDNTSKTSNVLVALSEPSSLLCRREGVKVGRDEGDVVGASLDFMRATARLSVCRRGSNVHCASILVVAQLDVLAVSALLEAEVHSARVVVVTVNVFVTRRLALAHISSCWLRNTVAHSVRVRVGTITCKLALVRHASSSLADCSKSSLRAVRVEFALAGGVVLESNLASPQCLITNCLVALVEVLSERASLCTVRVDTASARSRRWASGVVWNISVHAVSSLKVARIHCARLSVVAACSAVGVLADINSKSVLYTMSLVAFVLWSARLSASDTV